MKLKELKEIIARIDATNLRIAGFCDDYYKMPDELQIEVRTDCKEVGIYNTSFPNDEQKVFGPSETKARILLLPEEYDDYEVLLFGLENAETRNLNVKQVKKVVRLDAPGNPNHAGICLLGPVFHRRYRVVLIFADTRLCEEEDYEMSHFDEPIICESFDTEEEREDFIRSHADQIDESVGDRIVRF